MSLVQNLQADVRGMRSVVMQSSSVRNLLDLLVQSTNTDTARGARHVAVRYCAIRRFFEGVFSSGIYIHTHIHTCILTCRNTYIYV